MSYIMENYRNDGQKWRAGSSVGLGKVLIVNFGTNSRPNIVILVRKK